MRHTVFRMVGKGEGGIQAALGLYIDQSAIFLSIPASGN
jgi:hypothetical protein